MLNRIASARGITHERVTRERVTRENRNLPHRAREERVNLSLY